MRTGKDRGEGPTKTVAGGEVVATSLNSQVQSLELSASVLTASGTMAMCFRPVIMALFRRR